MSNPIVHIEGDTARCRVYMQAAHFLFDDRLVAETGGDGPEFTIGGYYDDHLVADPSGPHGWLIDGVTLTVWWRRGNEALMSVARERGTARLASGDS